VIEMLRSWLYVPGDDTRKLTRAASSEADVVVLDLEDGVAKERKGVARQTVEDAIRGLDFGDAKRYVRINAVGSAIWRRDLEAAVASGADGIVLPKANRARDVRMVAAELEAARSPARLAAIVAEEAEGVLAAAASGAAHERVHAILWGSEDLSASLGSFSSRHVDGELLEIFRLVRAYLLVVAAGIGRIAVDTPYVVLGDIAGLKCEARLVARMGFRGKQAIHLEQIGPINEAFLPTLEEEAAARAVVESLGAPGAGVARVAGGMVDAPHLTRALHVLEIADAGRGARA
jgi:citrate lyase subunit beta/citryl-CoA lyase